MQLFGGVVDVVQVVFDGKAHNTTVTLHDSFGRNVGHTVLTNQACCTVEEVELFSGTWSALKGEQFRLCRQRNGLFVLRR
jgi:hypothetical protein